MVFHVLEMKKKEFLKQKTMSNWSERDLAQLKARGSTVAEVERQIAAFRSGFPPTVLE